MKNKILLILFFLFIINLNFVNATVSGANVTATNSTRANLNSTATSHNAYSGNITEVIVAGLGVTQSWQGYFGNVSGVIVLSDANENSLYNWTLANPQGEIFATTNNSLSWGEIQCFNFTANGSHSDESGSGGTTNLYGTNLSQLESRFNIDNADFDGVNETFSAGVSHPSFFVGSLSFSSGECLSTRPYDSSGTSVAGNFEEVLLYEPTSSSIVFTSILESNLEGFNNADNDFEMLVLEDGHDADVSSTPYYFFVELE